MKRTALSAVGPFVLICTGVFLGRGAHATTEITFEGFTENNIDISTIAGYGSNVSASSADYNASVGTSGIFGTPGIGLTWGTGYQSYTAWDGRGNVAQTDFNLAGTIDLLFTPVTGSGVLVNSFALDEWNGGGSTSLSWSLFDTSGTLASGDWTKDDPGGRDTILTGLTPANVTFDEPVTLRLTLNSGSPSYVALDNLVFDEVVIPEPSTLSLGLLGAGLGALALRRRKQA